MKTMRVQPVDAASTSSGGSPSGPAGGDLGGGFPGPSVIGIDGKPFAAPGTETNGVVPTYNASTGKWDWDVPGGGGLPAGAAGQSLFLESDGSTPQWENQIFPVEAFGAVHDGTTDDTAAIQAAIDACMSAGGGTVFFANGIYAVNGSLVSTSTYNSQLTITHHAASGSNAPIAIAFVGQGPAAQSLNGTSNGFGPSQSGAILLSNWTGSISGNPAVIASGLHNGTGSDVNWIEVTFRNLEVRTPANPKLSAVDMTSAAMLNIDHCSATTAAANSSGMSLPSNANAVGWNLPVRVNANPPMMLADAWADGYYTGFRISEVAHGVNMQASHCVIGIECAGAEDHAANIDRVLFVACKNGISFTGGIFYLNVALLDIEHSVGSGTFQVVADVLDASNYGHGFIAYHTVQAGVAADDHLYVSGGANLSFYSAAGKFWTLNNVVAIPTGTDPFGTPGTGGYLYAASATGHPTWKDTSAVAHDLLAPAGSSGVGVYGLLVEDGASSPPVTLYTEDGTDWLYADG